MTIRARAWLLLLRLLGLVPLPLLAGPLQAFGVLAHRRNAKAAIRMRANMAQFLGPALGEEEVRRLVPLSRRHQLQAVLLLLHQTITGRTARLELDEAGAELLRDQPGRGCLLVSPHNGNAEVCAYAYMARCRRRFGCVVRPLDSPHRDQAVGRLRHERGVEWLLPTVGFPAREAVRYLRGGGVILASFDALSHTQGGQQLPVLGGVIDIATYPVKLARLSGARVLWVDSQLQGGSRLRAGLRDITQDIERQGAQALARHLEEAILRRPEQYIWSRKMRTEDAAAVR